MPPLLLLLLLLLLTPRMICRVVELAEARKLKALRPDVRVLVSRQSEVGTQMVLSLLLLLLLLPLLVLLLLPLLVPQR